MFLSTIRFLYGTQKNYAKKFLLQYIYGIRFCNLSQIIFAKRQLFRIPINTHY